MAEKIVTVTKKDGKVKFHFYCGTCLVPVEEDDRFCRGCGSRFSHKKEENNKSENA